MRARRLALVGIGCALVACGGGGDATDAGERDSGVDAAADGATDTGTDAALDPAPPLLTPCPPGWTEATGPSGIVHCDPWPSGMHSRCGHAELGLPGRPACAAIGSPCPADGWPAALPPGSPVVYLDASVTRGGDGATRSTAFRTWGEALGAAPEGAVLAVRAGTYDESGSTSLSRDVGISIVGACASGTVLHLGTTDPTGGLHLHGTASFRDVTIDNGPVHVGAGPLQVDGCVLDELELTACTATLRDTLLSAMQARGASVVDAQRIEVQGSPATALGSPGVMLVDGASRLTLADSTFFQSHGLLLTGLSSVVVVRTAFDGASIGARDGTLALTDCSVTGAGSDSKLSSATTITRTRFADNDDVSLPFGLVSEATDSTLTDVLVENVGAPTAPAGDGIVASAGGTLTLRRVAIVTTGTVGLAAYQGSVIEGRDVRVDAVRTACVPGLACPGPMVGGFGVASSMASVRLTSFSVRGADVCGLMLEMDGTMDLSHGWVDAAPIGACLQVTGFDATRLSNDVAFRAGVTVPLQATGYTLPPPP